MIKVRCRQTGQIHEIDSQDMAHLRRWYEEVDKEKEKNENTLLYVASASLVLLIGVIVLSYNIF
jgi:hypothetical protein